MRSRDSDLIRHGNVDRKVSTAAHNSRLGDNALRSEASFGALSGQAIADEREYLQVALAP
jgi:hypothetical protein